MEGGGRGTKRAGREGGGGGLVVVRIVAVEGGNARRFGGPDFRGGEKEERKRGREGRERKLARRGVTKGLVGRCCFCGRGNPSPPFSPSTLLV